MQLIPRTPCTFKSKIKSLFRFSIKALNKGILQPIVLSFKFEFFELNSKKKNFNEAATRHLFPVSKTCSLFPVCSSRLNTLSWHCPLRQKYLKIVLPAKEVPIALERKVMLQDPTEKMMILFFFYTIINLRPYLCIRLVHFNEDLHI